LGYSQGYCPDEDCSHTYKYRLFYGRLGKRIVGYDNERTIERQPKKYTQLLGRVLTAANATAQTDGKQVGS
jgi:hypothetical protein